MRNIIHRHLSNLATNKNVFWILLSISVITRIIGAYLGGTRAEDDDHWHLQMAQNFLAGNGIYLATPQGPAYSYIQPGFAFIHILFIPIFKNFFLAERILLVTFSSLTFVGFFYLAKRYFKPTTALAGTLFLLLYPPQWFWSTRLNPHSFATNILILSFMMLLVAWEKKSYFLTFMVGGLWGLLTLFRPEYQGGIACLALATFFETKKETGRTKMILLLLLGWIACLSPWAIRNHKIHGHYVLSSTELLAKIDAEPNEVKRATIYMKEGLSFIRNNPFTAIERCVFNFLTYWRPYLSFKVTSLLENVVYISSYLPLFVGFLFGLRLIPWKDPKWILIYTFMAYKVAAQTPFYMIVRFREATMPIMLLIAMLTIKRFFDKDRGIDLIER